MFMTLRNGKRGYLHINSNEYKKCSTKSSKNDIESLFRCECKYDPDGAGSACGRACWNRAIHAECDEDCPTKDRCLNRNFQRNRKTSELKKTIKLHHYGKKGYGVKAARDITKGEFVVEFVGEVISKHEFTTRSQTHYAGNTTFYLMAIEGDMFIDSTRKGNIGRFLNHSCKPNATTQKWFVRGKKCIGVFASTDIKKGDEITFDYQFDRFGDEKQVCLCGHKDVCRGYLCGKSNKSKNTQKPRKNKTTQQVNVDVNPSRGGITLVNPEGTDPYLDTANHSNLKNESELQKNNVTELKLHQNNSGLQSPPHQPQDDIGNHKASQPHGPPDEHPNFLSTSSNLPQTLQSTPTKCHAHNHSPSTRKHQLDLKTSMTQFAESFLPDAHESTRDKSFVRDSPTRGNVLSTRMTGEASSCTNDSKKFTQPPNLQEYERTRGRVKQLACGKCDKTFTRTTCLATHHRRMHSRKHFCETCGKISKSRGGLMLHRRIHSGEKPYVCKSCGKKFTQSGNLAAHERTHSDVRPFICKSCGKTFKAFEALKLHERVHSGEKPYGCKQCGKKFSQATNLSTHRRTHNGERPHVCKSCGRKFAHSSNLKRHEMIHNGVWPFVCKWCGKKARQLSHLKSHEGMRCLGGK